MKININRSLAVSEWENETLEMTKVSRLDIAAFLCIASVSVRRAKRAFNDCNQLFFPSSPFSPFVARRAFSI
jgi:hypothetical protein